MASNSANAAITASRLRRSVIGMGSRPGSRRGLDSVTNRYIVNELLQCVWLNATHQRARAKAISRFSWWF
jgi:hypothetical protein